MKNANRLSVLTAALFGAAVLFAGSASAQQELAAPQKNMPPVDKRPMPKTEGFDALDTSRDGCLQKEELAADPARQRKFEQYDTDGDGCISKAEWMNGQGTKKDK